MSPFLRAYYELRKALTIVRKNVRDVLTLGWRFHFRYGAALAGKTEAVIPIRKAGTLLFRLKGSDTETIREIFSHRVYDLSKNPHFSGLRRIYQDSIAAGMVPVIIDAGANLGAATVWFARQFPEARIVAIEPDPDNARVVRESIRQLSNAVLVEGAVGAETGFVHLTNTEAESNSIRTIRGGTDAGVKVYTVPDLLAMVEHGKLFMVKVDIEGFESDLFSGNTAWVEDADVIFVEPHDWMLCGKQTSAAFQKVLGQIGSALFIQDQNLVYVNPRAWQAQPAAADSHV